MSRTKSVTVTFAGCLLLFVLANLASVHFRSDGGLLEGLGVVGHWQDDIRGFGFPFPGWEEGGFAHRDLFSSKALLLNIGIAVLGSCLAAVNAGGFKKTGGRVRLTLSI